MPTVGFGPCARLPGAGRAYETHGIDELAPSKLADFLRIRYVGTNDAKRALGSVGNIRNAFIDIQGHLFR
ncbi:hypothetical protein [Roseitranquillus sediminis]|uniref:hypothetical protein n=1 Tax=Roseitranquillus sediminis TaxID=2809051 RepID=UPI001D0C6975|nr:hypothetical protein [Roseitranquillus sediminis]MBM9595928.1 hypothetical protein [Roseitranquillus sediminis]